VHSSKRGSVPTLPRQRLWRQRGEWTGRRVRLRRLPLRAEGPALLGPAAWRMTHCADCVRCVQTGCAKPDDDARCARGPPTLRPGQRPGRSPGTNCPEDCSCPGSLPRRLRRTPRPVRKPLRHRHGLFATPAASARHRLPRCVRWSRPHQQQRPSRTASRCSRAPKRDSHRCIAAGDGLQANAVRCL